MRSNTTRDAEPTRPFDCAGCGRAINSREIHHVDGGPGRRGRDLYCPDCAPAARDRGG